MHVYNHKSFGWVRSCQCTFPTQWQLVMWYDDIYVLWMNYRTTYKSYVWAQKSIILHIMCGQNVIWNFLHWWSLFSKGKKRNLTKKIGILRHLSPFIAEIMSQHRHWSASATFYSHLVFITAEFVRSWTIQSVKLTELCQTLNVYWHDVKRHFLLVSSNSRVYFPITSVFYSIAYWCKRGQGCAGQLVSLSNMPRSCLLNCPENTESFNPLFAWESMLYWS